MSKRGSYLNWMFDSKIKIPKTTQYNRAKLERLNKELNNSLNNNSLNNSGIIEQTVINNEQDNSLHDNKSIIPNIESVTNYYYENDANSDIINNDILINNINNNVSFSSDDDEEDYDEQDELTELENQLSSIDLEQLPIETTCAIMLNMFFNARLTQTALALVIKTFNLFKKSKIPSGFDGLANVLFKNLNDNREFIKKFYCNICSKLFNEKLERTVRRCSTCNSR